jgi:hypothetical protein
MKVERKDNLALNVIHQVVLLTLYGGVFFIYILILIALIAFWIGE